jgi:hypothetical protein
MAELGFMIDPKTVSYSTGKDIPSAYRLARRAVTQGVTHPLVQVVLQGKFVEHQYNMRGEQLGSTSEWRDIPTVDI